jgi:hypothetical protein
MKANYTLAQLRDIAESYYATYCVADSEPVIKLNDLLANKRTHIFLFECTDAFCEVRIVEEIDEDNYDDCECVSSSVTELSKTQYAERERTVADARFRKDRSAIIALQSLIVL